MSGIELITLAAVMDVVRGAIMTLFILTAFLVILIVLAQEGKGGGLAGAFGGAGTETFGVKAGTVNKATAWVGAAFLGLALLYAGLSTAQGAQAEGVDSISTPGDEATDEPGEGAKDGDAGTKDDDAGSKDEGAKDEGAKDEGAKDEGAKDGDGESKKDADEPKKDAGEPKKDEDK